jgi:hypothetical protein
VKHLLVIVFCFLFTHCASIQKSAKQGFLHCPQTHFSFDTLAFAAQATHQFMCINTGAQPLKIINIRTTCGCTVPQWDRNEIAPTDTTYISIQYDSRRSGGFMKEIIVYPSTQQKQLSLFISGEVSANPNKFIMK